MSRVRPYGDRAVLVETDAGHDAVLALARLVRDELAEAALEVVPGHRTVLVVGRDGPPDRARLAELAERAEDAPPAPEDDAPPVEIAVRYDGADLIGVAELCGVSPEELVRRHMAPLYRVAFVGFSPGFAYLVGGDPLLEVPRLAAAAHEHPGGQRRDRRAVQHRVPVGDARRMAAARDHRGAPVRSVRGAPRAARTRRTCALRGGAVIEVLRPGPLTTVQDAGRPGLAHLGVPHAGAADLPALRAANALAGNPPDAAALETTLSGPAASLHRRRGRRAAPAPRAGAASTASRCRSASASRSARGRRSSIGAARPACAATSRSAAGSTFRRCSAAARRTRSPVSGPRRCARGDVLPSARRACARPAQPVVPAPPSRSGRPRPSLRVVTGPRAACSRGDALEALTDERVQRVRRARAASACASTARRSSGAIRRAVVRGPDPRRSQVPAAGMPIAMLADHPTTGGYPVIAVVVQEHLPILGQLRPGRRVRFALAQPNEGESR